MSHLPHLLSGPLPPGGGIEAKLAGAHRTVGRATAAAATTRAIAERFVEPLFEAARPAFLAVAASALRATSLHNTPPHRLQPGRLPDTRLTGSVRPPRRGGPCINRGGPCTNRRSPSINRSGRHIDRNGRPRIARVGIPARRHDQPRQPHQRYCRSPRRSAQAPLASACTRQPLGGPRALDNGLTCGHRKILRGGKTAAGNSSGVRKGNGGLHSRCKRRIGAHR